MTVGRQAAGTPAGGVPPETTSFENVANSTKDGPRWCLIFGSGNGTLGFTLCMYIEYSTDHSRHCSEGRTHSKDEIYYFIFSSFSSLG
jgi:hypothetical protein